MLALHPWTAYLSYAQDHYGLVGPAHGKICLSLDSSCLPTKHVTLTVSLLCNIEAATPLLEAETRRSKLNAMSVLWPVAPPQPHLQISHWRALPSVHYTTHLPQSFMFYATATCFYIASFPDCKNYCDISWGRAEPWNEAFLWLCVCLVAAFCCCACKVCVTFA